jgi:outer membrane protein assembly factor BamB
VPVVALCTADLPSPHALGPVFSPSVGRLTDDEIPDLVLTNSASIPFDVIGGDSRHHFSLPAFGAGQVLLIDAEGDGESELYLVIDPNPYDISREVQRWAADGTQVWASPTLDNGTSAFSTYNGLPTAGDLDGDGIAELVFGEWVLDAVSGELVRQLDVGPDSKRGAVLADLEGDGTVEILLGRSVYGASPTPLWSADIELWGASSVALDLDDDPELEVVMSSLGQVSAYEADGTELWTVNLGGKSSPSPPCVADFDGDGELEIGVPQTFEVSVFEGDGSLLWSTPVFGPSGCSAADLDGDGRAELVLNNFDGLRILAGGTGEVMLHDPEVVGQYVATPAIVDLDGDGKAEIIAPSTDALGSALDGYRVYDSPLWPSVGPQWSMSDVSDERLSPEGQVSARTSGLTSARTPSSPGQPGPSPLLQVELHDLCSASCDPDDGLVRISAVVRNVGAVDAEAGLSLQVYDRREAEVVLVAEVALPAIPSGTALDALTVDLAPVAGPDELFVKLTGDHQCLASRVVPEPCE